VEILEFVLWTILPLKVTKTIGQYKRFKPKFTLEEVFKNVYRIPESSSQPSIDSYIRTSGKLILFQITRNLNHPISSAGLIDLFKRLDILTGVKENPAIAVIVFVVPKGLGTNFSKQNISNLEVFSMNDVNNRECSIIPGIKQAKKRKLEDIGIKNCQELIAAFHSSNPNISFVRENTRKFIEGLEYMQNLEFLSLIPQFVLELDYSESKEKKE
jgi:hypothetical protein